MFISALFNTESTKNVKIREEQKVNDYNNNDHPDEDRVKKWNNQILLPTMDFEQISSKTRMCQHDIYFEEDRLSYCSSSALSVEFTTLGINPERLIIIYTFPYIDMTHEDLLN